MSFERPLWSNFRACERERRRQMCNEVTTMLVWSSCFVYSLYSVWEWQRKVMIFFNLRIDCGLFYDVFSVTRLCSVDVGWQVNEYDEWSRTYIHPWLERDLNPWFQRQSGQDSRRRQRGHCHRFGTPSCLFYWNNIDYLQWDFIARAIAFEPY
jgi:hypothetical protein